MAPTSSDSTPATKSTASSAIITVTSISRSTIAKGKLASRAAMGDPLFAVVTPMGAEVALPNPRDIEAETIYLSLMKLRSTGAIPTRVSAGVVRQNSVTPASRGVRDAVLARGYAIVRRDECLCRKRGSHIRHESGRAAAGGTFPQFRGLNLPPFRRGGRASGASRRVLQRLWRGLRPSSLRALYSCRNQANTSSRTGAMFKPRPEGTHLSTAPRRAVTRGLLTSCRRRLFNQSDREG